MIYFNINIVGFIYCSNVMKVLICLEVSFFIVNISHFPLTESYPGIISSDKYIEADVPG